MSAYWDQIKLGCFCLLYIILVIPLIIAVVRDHQSDNTATTTTSIFVMKGSGTAIGEWLGVLLLLYLMLWAFGKAGFKVNHKSPDQHKDDILRMLYYGIVLGSLGGVAGRIDSSSSLDGSGGSGGPGGDSGSTYFPLAVGYYCIVFTAMFELVRDYQIELSVNGFTSSIVSILVVVSSMALCILVVVSHVLAAARISRDFLSIYANVILGCFLVHLILFLPSKHVSVHVHHWYWSLPLAHMCIFNTDVSMIAQAMFLGIHVHGVACFGIESLFYKAPGAGAEAEFTR